MMLEARWRQLVVSADDPLADEQIAEAIARVLSRYAVDFRSGVEVSVPHDGASKLARNLVSHLRAARTAPAALDLDVAATARAGR